MTTQLPSYRDLDINQKVELKALLRAWATISVERFQRSLQSNVYDRPVKRSRRRTNRLKADWQITEKGGTENPGVLISSLYYGRFVELGVSRGVVKNSMRAKRRARRWYTPVKNRELATIRGLLIQRYSLALISIASRQLAGQVTVAV